MADSLRQQIIDALDTRLKNILTANGYETDIGSNVFQWRDEAISEDELPVLIYRDVSDSPVAETVSQVEHQLKIEVDIAADTMATLRKAKADLLKCLGTDVTFGGLAEDTSIPEDITGIELRATKYFAVSVKFVITYVTERFDPYS